MCIHVHVKRPAGNGVSGRNIAHATRDAMQCAFLGADIKLGNVAPEDLTDVQIAQLVGASLPYLRSAVKVATRPELRARVERHELSLTDAAKSLRPQQKQPQPAPDLFSQFAAATRAVRAECMAAFVDETIALLDDTTAPVGSAMSDSFVHF